MPIEANTVLSESKVATADRDETEMDHPQATLWYHFLAKGWECPGHNDSYKSSSCIGAVYVG